MRNLQDYLHFIKQNHLEELKNFYLKKRTLPNKPASQKDKKLQQDLDALLEEIFPGLLDNLSFEEHFAFLSLQEELLLQTLSKYTDSLSEGLALVSDIRAYYAKKTKAPFAAHLNSTEQLKKDLKQMQEELSQFSYMASHDLQEPLRMIASYLQLLQRRYESKLDDTGNEFISYAVDGSKRMRVLIDDLLTYSRTGTRELVFERINTGKLVEEVIQGLRKQVTESHAEIQIEALPEIKADAFQMKQVFHHLIDNSLKFNKTPSPKITISCEERINDYLFSVKDNGIGIDKSFWERVFIIFQRLHSKNEYEGTGIGLAVCKRIIERHKGKMWLESETGKGSTFFFTLNKVLSAEN